MISLRSIRNIATLLSVALAVTGLVASFNYSATAEERILGTLDSLSPELLLVRYDAEAMNLTQIVEDQRELKRHFGDAITTAPLVSESFNSKTLLGKGAHGQMVYSTPSLMDILTLSINEGAFWLPGGEEGILMACGLAPLFGGSDSPVGLTVFLNKDSYFVEGTFSCDDKLLGINWQRAVLVPFREYGTLQDNQKVQLVIRFAGQSPTQAQATVDSVLMRIRDTKDYSLVHFENMLENKRKITRSIRILTESISLIVLLMASVSCMNIFFISVNERTREIGLRRALGATHFEIIRLVMFDCYVFMAIGTVVGLFGGYAFTNYLMKPLLLIMPEFAGWTFDAHSDAISKTLLFLLVSSSLSGLFPAIRAAKIDPAAALRE